MFKRMNELFWNKEMRAVASQDMKDRLAWWKRRQRQGVQIIEVEDAKARSGIGEYQALLGELGLKDIIRLAKESKITVTEAWLAALVRGMKWIAAADEAIAIAINEGTTRRAIRLATEDAASALEAAGDVAGARALRASGVELTPEIQRAADAEFIAVMKETQMTGDIDTRSTMQLDPNFLNKSVTQISTEPRKAWQLLDKTISHFINKPKSERTEADKQALMNVILPMMGSAAYITAVGVTGRALVGLPQKLMRSEEKQKRIDAHTTNLAVSIFNEAANNILGMAPVVGPVATGLIQAATGQRPFSILGVPLFKEADQALAGLHNRSAEQMLKGLGRLTGVPGIPTNSVSTLAGRLQEALKD